VHSLAHPPIEVLVARALERTGRIQALTIARARIQGLLAHLLTLVDVLGAVEARPATGAGTRIGEVTAVGAHAAVLAGFKALAEVDLVSAVGALVAGRTETFVAECLWVVGKGHVEALGLVLAGLGETGA